MRDEEYLLEDGTVNFLPNRLNRQPVIVRGLTADELWLTVAITGLLGLGLGIVVALLTGQIGMAPTTVLVSIAAGVFIGGSLLRRKKRGRPDTWLYRQMQWQLKQRMPMLGKLTGGQTLITLTSSWEVKREQLARQDPKRRPHDPGNNKKREE
jgi:conjugative transfer region protein (TIGR03750 family)